MLKRCPLIIICVIMVTLVPLLMVSENAFARDEYAPGKFVYTDFEEKKIGVPTGTIWERIVTDVVKGVPVYYSDMTAGLEDVKKGRIDGFVVDRSTMKIASKAIGNENLIFVEIPPEHYAFGMGFISLDQNSIDRFNAFLSELTEEGIFNDIQEYWLNDDQLDLDAPMRDTPLSSGENGIIKIAIVASDAPYTYKGGSGEFKGYCIEIMLRFAAWEGKTLEIAEMDPSGLIPYVISGKADFGVSDITMTEERKKSVLFTNPVFDEMLETGYIAAQPETALSKNNNFFDWLKTGIERNLITDDRWKLITDGLRITLIISLLAQLFGTAFGCFICWLLTRKNKFIKWLGNLYCGFIHGMPAVVLLMITYYIIFGSTNISNVLMAVAAFSMLTGASVAVNLKGAIDTIDPVEVEAARSIGFTAFGAFRTVTLPQAARRVLPAYTNGFVELVKATAIVGYIAIQDLTRAGDIIRSRTYDAYFALMFVALIYLAVTALCVRAFKSIAVKVNGNN